MGVASLLNYGSQFIGKMSNAGCKKQILLTLNIPRWQKIANVTILE